MMKEFQGKKFDYVWVIDWDMLPWKAETVASAFLQKQPWDMVCANGVMSKYDMRYVSIHRNPMGGGGGEVL